MKKTCSVLAVLLLSSAVAEAAAIRAPAVAGGARSRIDDVIALKESIDAAKAKGERYEVKPTGDAAFDREIRKFADGKTVFWTGDATPPAPLARKDVSTTPESRIGWFEHWFKDDPDWWLKRLRAKRDEIRNGSGKYDIVFLGDSISQRWETCGTNEYAHLKRDFSVLNLGYAGDRTQHLLWRLKNGENDGWKAKCIFILIGTNNYEDAPSYMSWGVRDILKLVREKHPEAKIFLSSIFPRNRAKKDSCRYKNDCANELFRQFVNGRDVIWFDIEREFLDPDGSLPASLFPDALHPNAQGYEIFRVNLLRKFQEVFGAEAPSGFREAQWIGYPGICCASSSGPAQPVPVFRKTFEVGSSADAELLVSGLGYFVCEIDGRRVSDARLVPAPTQYDRRWRYRRFPLKGLAAGRHEMRVSVGGGLYYPQTDEIFGFRDAPWRDYPKMICEIHDAAGRVLLKSDDSWSVSAGPIVFSTLRGGETYDARLEPGGGGDAPVRVPTDESCQPMKRKAPRREYAKIVAPPGGVAEEETFAPCRVTGVLPLVRKPGTNLWIAPSNMTGVVRLRAKGPRGSSVVLRHGERLNAAGDALDNKMIEMFVKDGTFQRDEYILKGAGAVEEWTPEFTFHGFQYVEAVVSNGAEIVSLDALEIHTDFKPVGTFKTSDPKLAALHLCGLRSCLGNWVGGPMDCPHREKNGWTSEARLMCAALLHNYDCTDAYRAWLRTVADAQRPSGQLPGIVPTAGWGYNWGAGPVYDSALVLIPWDVWTIRKDRSLLEEFYPNMKRLMDYYNTIVTHRGLVAHGLGDWLPPPGAAAMPRDYVQTAFVIRMLEITAQTARMLGFADEAKTYGARRQKMLSDFRAAFFGETANRRTTFYALALAFNLLYVDECPIWAKMLAERVRANGHKVDYGTVGSGCVLRELCKRGYRDDAYKLMTQPENPGYWHWIGSKNLTLFPETFEAGVDGSRNHGAFADVVAVLDEHFRGGPEPADLKTPALPPVAWLKAGTHAPLRLVENGELKFAIVGEFKAEAAVRGPEGQQLAAKERNDVRRGANELAAAVKRAFGKEPLVCEPDDPRAAAYPYAIALGETKHSRALGVDPKKLPREGFEIRTFEKGVVIVGNNGFRNPGEYDVFNWRCGRLTCNGTEWGAIDFAERVFGLRYFSVRDKALWTYAPTEKNVVLSPAAWRDWPRCKFRGNNAEHKRVAISTDFFGGEAPNPMTLAKAHPDKLETIFYRDSHGRLWQDPKTYVNNYFDVTNPEFADLLVDDFRDYFAKNGVGSYWGQTWAPSSRYIWFGQCDAGKHMDNERAKKWARENPIGCDTESEVYGEFYRVLGEKCRAAFPNHTLVLMAYSNYLLAPRRQERLPENVQILACIGTPVYVRSAKYRADLAEVYGGWNRLMQKGRKCVAYTYDLGYQKDALIPQTLRGWYEGDFLKTMAPYVSGEVVYPCNYDHGKSNYAASYLTYRCLWNPDYDVAAGLRDYFEKTCGKASGGELFAFYRLLVRTWEERMIPEVKGGMSCIPAPNYKLMYTKVYTEDVVRRLIAHLDAAERALPPGADFRARFDNFAAPFRRVLPDIVAYQHIAIPRVSAAGATGPVTVDGVPDEPAWAVAGAPKFHRAFAGGGTVVSPDCRLLWDAKGLYLSVRSPAPYKPGKGLWDGDSVEFMIAAGDPERPANLYQFVFCANGSFEDYHMPLDQPRGIDSSWTAVGCAHKVVRGDGWTGELFVPWSAFKDAAPKKGDVWRMNLISNRWEPQEKATPFSPAEYSSWSATLNNNRNHDLYAHVLFE